MGTLAIASILRVYGYTCASICIRHSISDRNWIDLQMKRAFRMHDANCMKVVNVKCEFDLKKDALNGIVHVHVCSFDCCVIITKKRITVQVSEALLEVMTTVDIDG